MPELVEVENYRRLLLTLKKSTSPSLISINLPSPKPPKTFPSTTDFEILKKCSVKDVERKGKLLRLVLGRSDLKPKELIHLYLHMGMTGRISTPNEIPVLESLSEAETFPPPHTHLILEADGNKVAYSDPRRFGGVSLDEPLSNQWDEFAIDALDPEASLKDLVGRKKGVKGLLLDQRAIVSGVGNWIADEILYQSKIHPDQTYLTFDEVNILEGCLKNVLKIGNECLSAKKNFPCDWIFHRRWSKGKGDEKDTNGYPVTFVSSGGRSSAIVSKIQKKKSRKPKPEAKPVIKKNADKGELKKNKGSNKKSKRKTTDDGQAPRRSKRIASAKLI